MMDKIDTGLDMTKEQAPGVVGDMSQGPAFRTGITAQTVMDYLTRKERQRVRAGWLDIRNSLPHEVLELAFPKSSPREYWNIFHQRTDGRYRGDDQQPE